MEKIESKREFKKDILLLLIGALLALIPSLLSSYIQGNSELQQLILDRKISTLKDYSKTYNKLVSDLLPKIELLEDQILYMHDIELKENKFDQEVSINANNNFKNFLNQYNNWLVDVNTQTLIINALYDTNLPLNTISYSDPLKNYSESNYGNELITKLKDDIIYLKKETVEQINSQQNIMGKLSLLIKD